MLALLLYFDMSHFNSHGNTKLETQRYYLTGYVIVKQNGSFISSLNIR